LKNAVCPRQLSVSDTACFNVATTFQPWKRW
jgi:hypothetical protein